jgi:UDP-N-acetylglucosamine 4,6-dehydratase (inverting)
MLDHARILITGGTGSLGKHLVATLLARHPSLAQLVVFSRDEQKQYEMAQTYPRERFPAVRFTIGDVRDAASLRRAMDGVDCVIHSAALKHVPVAERNPFEAIQTNVLGAQNVIDAAVSAGVQRVVALSTDKAAAPINVYGATKLCSDKLFIAANGGAGGRLKTSVVRYGNVLASRGSVVPFFLEQRKTGMLPITDPRMTRFNITLAEGTDLVLFALEQMWGGELFVPKVPSFRISDLAEAIGPNCERRIIGLRPGEKVHEELITETDGANTLEFEKYYVVVPTEPSWNVDDYLQHFHGRRCPPGFSYGSNTNSQWLPVNDIRELCRRHVDPTLTF